MFSEVVLIELVLRHVSTHDAVNRCQAFESSLVILCFDEILDDSLKFIFVRLHGPIAV